jgi:hypothetical protein
MERYCFREKTAKILFFSHGFGLGARLYLWRNKRKADASFFEVKVLEIRCIPKSASWSEFEDGLISISINPGCVYNLAFLGMAVNRPVVGFIYGLK